MRRRYTQREKVTAVIAAEMTNGAAAARAVGTTEASVSRWRHDPAMQEYVTKTRDQLGDEMAALAALALATIQADVRAGRFEPRDLVMLLGVATEKSLLLSGAATSRTETRDLTGSLPDTDIRDAIREAERLISEGRAPTATEGSSEG